MQIAGLINLLNGCLMPCTTLERENVMMIDDATITTKSLSQKCRSNVNDIKFVKVASYGRSYIIFA